jgi:hypothetical protein
MRFSLLREDFVYSPCDIEFFGGIKIEVFLKSVKSIARQKRRAAFKHHRDIVKISGDGSHNAYMELPFFVEG